MLLAIAAAKKKNDRMDASKIYELAPRLRRKRQACSDHVNFAPSFRVAICYAASRETSISD
jgi:hypothetical protein